MAFILEHNIVREHIKEEYSYQLAYKFENKFGGFTTDFDFFLEMLNMDTNLGLKIIRDKIINAGAKITEDYNLKEYFYFKDIPQAKELLNELNILLKMAGEN